MKLLILYTGGTIGMVAQRDGSLVPFHAEALRANVPDLSRLQAEVDCRSLGQPKDSSDLGPDDWRAMADALWAARDEYDGFVVLHGTDTMAYSASALSFMLGGSFGKPVVLTGSQVPLGVLRSDGRDNLLTALEIAMLRDGQGAPLLREVTVFFENRLFRGNRVYKNSARQFDAFLSPNYPELGRTRAAPQALVAARSGRRPAHRAEPQRRRCNADAWHDRVRPACRSAQELRRRGNSANLGQWQRARMALAGQGT